MWEGPVGHILVDPAKCGTEFVLPTTYTRAAVGLDYFAIWYLALLG